MPVRLRLPELLVQHGLTAYELAKRSGGRLSLSAAYRLAATGGRFTSLPARHLEALAEVFGVEPGALFTSTPVPRRRRR